jgi:hypothetical protein
MGVTVHRGDDTPAPDATEDKPSGTKPVQLFASGVRIHRDAVRPTASGYGALVGPEEAPDAI